MTFEYTQSHPSGYFVYDYFLKDHLGNISSTITDEQDTAFYPVASLESSTINNEKIYYTGLDNGVVDRTGITNYPTNDSYTNPNTYTQKLRGDGVKIGAGILLKVMAGDTINVHASSWYKLNGATPDAPVSPLSDVVSAIINSLPVASGNKFINGQVAGSMLNPSVTTFLNNRDATGNSARPNSWLNIIVLDEQLKPVITSDGNNSYFAQVGASNSASVIQYNPSRAITKSGYVYIYVSNETPNIYTYWDNLQVTHIHGPLLQEEGYYPFGLEMKAISSAAALKMQTNYKFNAGTNLESDFDVDYYETFYRQYDVQTGRFTGIDMLAESYARFTPYNFAVNNPANLNDPTGANVEDDMNAWRHWVPYSDNAGTPFDRAQGWDPFGEQVRRYGDPPPFGGNGGDGASSTADILNQLSKIVKSGMSINEIIDENGNSVDAARWTFNNGYVTSLSTISSNSMNLYTSQGKWNISLGGGNSNMASKVNYNADVNDRFKQFIAIVAGESSNNFSEAGGIGSVIFNRMKLTSTNFAEDFVSNIGGEAQFDAIGGSIYNEIMNMSWQEINSNTNVYATRISGAIWSLFGMLDFSNGAYFWNASSQQYAKDIGFNWRQYNNGTFTITTTLGGTTFFKYTDPNKHWP